MDDLTALYEYYQIDTHLYPPPNLKINQTIQSQLLEMRNDSLLKHYGNDKRKKFKTRNKNSTVKFENNCFHQHYMITVRQIVSNQISNSQSMTTQPYDDEHRNHMNEKIINRCE